MKALRQTVDLSAYPDLVVVYLGMTVNVLTGVKTLLGFGPKIEGSVAARPDGLLLHENIFYSLFPLHLGMRQYWRTANCGSSFYETLAELVFGTNFILHGVVLKRCTSMSSDPSAFSVLPRRHLQKVAYFQLVGDYTETEWRTQPRRIPKQMRR
jgi:hypothetical protein